MDGEGYNHNREDGHFMQPNRFKPLSLAIATALSMPVFGSFAQEQQQPSADNGKINPSHGR